MLEEQKLDPDQGKALTLPNLMLLWSFVAPSTAIGGCIKAGGGGSLRYCVGIPTGLVIGAIIVYLNWNLWRYLLLRSGTCSVRRQNWIGLGIFALLMNGIGVGYFAGFYLGRIVIQYVA
jgi:hypothetical protein